MASLVYLVLYLYLLHAYSARPLTVSNKDVKILDRATNVFQLDDQNPFSVKEANENTKGKISHSWKILLQATGTEIWKRTERSTLESPPSSANENVSSNNKGRDSVEDIAVMDYAQPHRKPPIHNKGT